MHEKSGAQARPFRLLAVGEGVSLWFALHRMLFDEKAPEGFEGVELHWLEASQSQLALPSPLVGTPERLAAPMSRVLQSEAAELAMGDFVREYRNQSFRRLTDARRDSLWAPEKIFASATGKLHGAADGVREGARDTGLLEVLERVRAEVLSDARVKRMTGKALREVTLAQQGAVTALFEDSATSQTETLTFDGMLDADGVASGVMERFLNKSLSTARQPGRHRTEDTHYAALQLEWVHHPDLLRRLTWGGVSGGISGGVPRELFLLELNRESGETVERRVLGTFWVSSQDHQLHSRWTVFFTEAEGMDNHLIMKRLRRVKQAVSKAFHSEPWCAPETASDFLASVTQERFRWVQQALSIPEHRAGASLVQSVRVGEAPIWSWNATVPWWETFEPLMAHLGLPVEAAPQG